LPVGYAQCHKSVTNHLKTKRRISPYRAVNTFQLGYKNQSFYVVTQVTARR